ncbi:hypothetical protein FRB98_006278 [Tulasnella sp. 332]|nr:hypothetical protein FRB98_006278 [Tulasnella sp. 332]
MSISSGFNQMIPRRTTSTTSLSRFYHELPEADHSSLDFCNSFWGPNDCGVDVLFARMRGASRTMEELRAFWKERVAIEEDYSKRLGKLAKLPLGRDEIGDLRAALDTLRVETDQQSAQHMQHAQTMRRELEQPAVDFITKQNNHKKTFQTSIEKSYKAKQTQEKYVEKAREKYESDCQHINSYTAQSTLLQGKELERIHLKLERVQQTVQANERDYQNFARALSDTAKRWEGEWKTYCDQSQDLEDERIEFMKDNIWAYANAISTICVSDDESCEKVRVNLEQVEAEKDMENFVRDYGTGGVMQQPIAFVSYKPGANPPPPGTKAANFLRTSVRAPLQRPSPVQAPPPDLDFNSGPGAAGIGAGGSRAGNSAGVSSGGPGQNGSGGQTSDPRTRSAQPQAVPPQQTGSSQALSQPTNTGRSQQQTQSSRGNVDPPTMLSIGGNAYAVDPNSDPQSGQSARRVPGTVGDEKDPIAQALDALRKGGGVSRNGVGSIRSPAAGGSRSGGAATATSPAPKSRQDAPPAQQPRPTSMDYHNVANNIVGVHPSSRPTSPMDQPRAAMMQPPQTQRAQLNEVHQQAFPGERRLSINREAMTPSGSVPPARSPSPGRDGFAGIGAQGRSTSPQPYHGGGSRGASPSIPQQQYGQQAHPVSASAGRPLSATGYAPNQQGTVSPAPLGIALDASGRVAHDSMAEQHARAAEEQAQRDGRFYSRQPPAIDEYAHQQAYNRPPQQAPPPNQYAPQQGYGGYQQPSSQHGTPAPAANGYHDQSTPASSVPPSNSYGQQGYQGGYAPPPSQQPAQPTGPPQQTYPSSNGYFPQQQSLSRPTSAAPRRSPSPAMGPAITTTANGEQVTDDGSRVLFTVKALYDYVATTAEEFDFQSGDIIAVTATPDDDKAILKFDLTFWHLTVSHQHRSTNLPVMAPHDTTNDEERPLLDGPANPGYNSSPSSTPVDKPLNDPSSVQLALIFSALWAAVFLGALDTTIVATLLASIGSYFNRAHQASYLGSAYLLSVCCFTPLYGRLSDIMGRKGAMQLGLSLFGECPECIANSSTAYMCVFIVMSVLSIAYTIVSSITISDLIPLKKRGMYQGLTNILYGLGAALGGPLGGFINDHFGWRWAFFIQAPILLLAFILVVLFVDVKLPDQPQTVREKVARIDYLGSLTLVIGVGCSLLAVTLKGSEDLAWGNPLISGLLVLGVVFVIGFVGVEGYVSKEPIMPLRLLKQRTPLAVALTNFFQSMVTFSILYNVPMYYQAVLLESAQTSGTAVLILAIGSFGAGLYMRWTGRFYYLTILSGLSTILSTSLLASWDEAPSSIHVWGDILPSGLGAASVVTTTLIALIASIDRADIAVATGMSYLFRTTGQVVGVGLSGALLQSVLVKNLRERITGPGSAEIIRSIRHSTTIIPDLPLHLRQAAVKSYAISIQTVFIAQVAFAIITLLCLVPIEENPLPSSMAEQKEQDDRRRVERDRLNGAGIEQ